MKNQPLTVFFVLMVLPIFSAAQKAYEAIPYKGVINNKLIKLIFADGYIGASSITFIDKKTGKKVLFLPDVGYVGEDKKLKFHRSLSSPFLSSDYFTLINLTEYYDTLPKSIDGSYYNKGKTHKIKFSKL